MPSEWRQGSVFQITDVQAVLAASVDHRPSPAVDASVDRLMVLTQDCDLVHERLEDEPWAEIIPLRPLGPYNKGRDNPCLHGKNPRRLVFQIEGESPATWWCLEPHSRFRIPREILAPLDPDPEKSLPEKTAQVLARWISRRYTRAAMADAFNIRLRQKTRELGDLWKSVDAEAVSGVYLLGAREELPEGQNYQLDVLLSIASESSHDSLLLERAQRVSRTLDTILDSCPGIEVVRLSEKPEQDITLRDLRNYQRLDLDYRSGTDRPNASRPVDDVD
jgi:hypothetical protein